MALSNANSIPRLLFLHIAYRSYASKAGSRETAISFSYWCIHGLSPTAVSYIRIRQVIAALLLLIKHSGISYLSPRHMDSPATFALNTNCAGVAGSVDSSIAPPSNFAGLDAFARSFPPLSYLMLQPFIFDLPFYSHPARETVRVAGSSASLSITHHGSPRNQNGLQG